MKIYHKQFVIEIFENDNKFIAMADKPYRYGCSSGEYNDAVTAIYDAISRADYFFGEDEKPYVVLEKGNVIFASYDSNEIDKFWENNYVPGRGMEVITPLGFVAIESDDLPF